MTNKPEVVEMWGFRFHWVTSENAQRLNEQVARGEVTALYFVDGPGMSNGVLRTALAGQAKPRALAFVLGTKPSDQLDLSILQEHPQIEFVSWDQPPASKVSLSHFTELTQCAIGWSTKVEGLESLSKLKWLRLSKYKPRTAGLDELAACATTLERLDIVRGSLTDFSLLHTFVRLYHLSVSYVRDEIDLSTLKSTSLLQLELDRCPNLSGELTQTHLPRLERLWGSSAPSRPLRK